MYQFSPTSIALLQRCIEVANSQNEPNPWREQFSRYFCANQEPLGSTPATADDTSDTQNTVEEIEKYSNVGIEKLDEIITDPINNMTYILKGNTDDKLVILAKKLDDVTTEKFCTYVFQNVKDCKFIEAFFINFLPNIFKRKNTRLSLDLLTHSYKSFTDHFKILLQQILLQSDIDNSILQEFVSILSPSEQTMLLKKMIECDLPPQTFKNYLFTINVCYKVCLNDSYLESFILSVLKETSGSCTVDKNFGRLLLTYLQKKNYDDNLDLLKSIVEAHKSIYRRPCLNVLKEKSCDE